MAREQANSIAAQRDRLGEALRGYGAGFTELGRRFAESLGVHATDAFALLEIATAEEAGTPLQPALLAKRIALSSGAMTALLNRLERAGYITRGREHADRRVVTLRCSARAKKLADDFFDSANRRQDAVLAQYPPELLLRFEELLVELGAALVGPEVSE
ncbi:MarR family winged helix-turn-helix transcriptional regulator [Nocardia otitidiscaviarum]|uniref:MarR family transcriptional regulator n=1 Tax=Nocardia otitidiscaviarum TaxID=1823 RepID=A0A516NJK7_9NOCA|nr:MarR family transcriptional regulator [Nocardia otitidiscaviarum]MBF6180069.1 MarR family transcriptional regulator [Nocardia otitidiscaviarum]MCP9625046.1 MarR family transcriptional regulator [Nocardia otitidiscaviarum]QDP79090.1 MarR family transcriptional regulator [Nocardia otitidiscaviarum]